MKNIIIEFGGYYASIHGDNISNMIDEYYQDDNGESLDYSNLDIDYRKIYNLYSVQYISFLNDYINEEINIQSKLKFVSLHSPREYNFTTDKIEASLPNKEYKQLCKYFLKNSDFLEWLKRATLSRSGYHSYYNFYGAISNKDNILLDYAFKWLCTKISDEFDSYYDHTYMYELLHIINMPRLTESEI